MNEPIRCLTQEDYVRLNAAAQLAVAHGVVQGVQIMLKEEGLVGSLPLTERIGNELLVLISSLGNKLPIQR